MKDKCPYCNHKLQQFSATQIRFCPKCNATWNGDVFVGWGQVNEQGDFVPELEPYKPEEYWEGER